MKKLKISAFIIVLLVLSISCSSDNEEDIKISQEQLDAITGTWNLIALNVNPPQDANNDGTSSENMVEELNCLTATLLLKEDFTWSSTKVGLFVTPITGDLFGISCTEEASDSGSWQFLNNKVVLSEDVEDIFELNGNLLTINFNNDLPDFQSIVYQKQ